MKSDYDRWREQVSRRAEALEAASVESANQALKALLLLNGGACIAVLGFLASVFPAATLSGADGDFVSAFLANFRQGQSAPQIDAQILVADFLRALVWFSLGAGAAVVASC